MPKQSREEIERERAEWEAKSIGPTASALLVLPVPSVFFKVRWNSGLEAVERLANDKEEIECVTTWSAYVQDSTSAVLHIEWPEVDVSAALYFEIAKWRTELGVVRDGDGMLFVVPEGKLNINNTPGLTVQVYTGLLAEILGA